MKISKVNDFTQGKILGPLLKFTVPILLALLVQSLYGAVDLLIVGQFSTTVSVSGVSMGAQVTNSLMMIIANLAMGTTVLLGQFIGQKKLEEGGRTVGNSIWLFGALAIICMVLLFTCAAPALRLFRLPEASMAEGTIYIRICSAGYLFIVAYNIIGSVLRGIGDSKTPLITVSIACVVNIVGDLLLVAVFHMAAAGAAIATVAAQAVSVVISLIIVKKKGLPFHFGKESMKLDWKLIGRILKLGAPLGLQEIVVTGSFLINSSVVNTLGVVASAAVGVAGRLFGFVMLFPSAFMQSTSAFVAQNIGAERIDRAKKALFHGIWLSLAFATLMSFFSIIHGTWLTQIFSRDHEVILASAEYLKAYGIDTFLTSVLFCFIGFLNGCGKTTVTMIQGFVGVAVRIPGAFLLLKIGGGDMFLLGLATPIASVFQVILCIVYYLIVKKSLERQYGGGIPKPEPAEG